MNPIFIILAILAVVMLLVVSTPSTVTAMTIAGRFQGAVASASTRFAIPQARIFAIIAQESSGRVDAIGLAGERGLMQMTQGALADVNAVFGFGFSFADMFDAEKAIFAGTAYLRIQLNQFGNLDTATRAYNAGADNVRKSSTAGQTYLSDVLRWEIQFIS